MPEAGEVAPLVGGLGFLGNFREHLGGKFGGVVGDFVEVAVLGFEICARFAGVALAFVFARAERGEEGFPGGGVRVGGCAVREFGGVGVEGHGRGSGLIGD